MPSIIILLLQFFLSMAGAFLIFCKLAHDYTAGGYVKFMETLYKSIVSSDFNTGVMLVYAVIVVIAFGLWYRKDLWEKPVEKKSFGGMTEKPAYFIAGVILLAFGMQYLCMYFTNIVAMIFPHWLETYETLMEGMGLTEEVTIPLVLYSVIIGPICEEITFRGLTMGYAKRFSRFWVANIIQAILFAGMHMNPLQSSYTFLVGLVFGYFVHRAGNLWMGIILHITFNAMGVLGNSLIVGGTNPITFCLILFGSMVATYIGFELIYRNIPASVNNQSNSSDNSFTA